MTAERLRLVCTSCGEVPEAKVADHIEGDQCPMQYAKYNACPGGTLNWRGPNAPYAGWSPLMPSMAVVANNCGDGAVLWHVGLLIDRAINEEYGNALPDLGLNDAPHGISVWVRSMADSVHFPDKPLGKTGRYREPTDGEWAAIVIGANPWEIRSFKLKGADVSEDHGKWFQNFLDEFSKTDKEVQEELKDKDAQLIKGAVITEWKELSAGGQSLKELKALYARQMGLPVPDESEWDKPEPAPTPQPPEPDDDIPVIHLDIKKCEVLSREIPLVLSTKAVEALEAAAKGTDLIIPEEISDEDA